MKHIAVALVLISTPAIAYDPPAAFMQQYQGMANTGSLYLRYCLVGNHVCISRHAEAWGQVCEASLARSMGRSHEFGWRGDIEGDVDGVVLPGYHYAGWYCKLDNPADAAKYHVVTEATADEFPDMPPIPKWASDKKAIDAAYRKTGATGIVSWSSTGGMSGEYVAPTECDTLNYRGRPIKSWWARADGQCYAADAPK